MDNATHAWDLAGAIGADENGSAGCACPGSAKIAEFDQLLSAVRARVLKVDDRKTSVLPGEGWMAIARRATGIRSAIPD